ncbi:hypothetical protein IWQ61_006477, partial [Dispira simplex]
MDDLNQGLSLVKSSLCASKCTSTTGGFTASSRQLQTSKESVVSNSLHRKPDGGISGLDTFITTTMTTDGANSTLEPFTETTHTFDPNCSVPTNDGSSLLTSEIVTTGGGNEEVEQLSLTTNGSTASLEINPICRRIHQEPTSTDGYSTYTGYNTNVGVSGTLCAVYESRVTRGDVGLCALDLATGRCTLAQVMVAKRAPTDGPSYLLTSLLNSPQAPFSILPVERRLFRPEQGFHYLKSLHTESPDNGLSATLIEQELGDRQLGLACVGAVFGQLEQIQGITLGHHSIHFSLASGK